MESHEYQSFLTSKSQLGSESGFKPLWIPDFLFDFQAAGVEWGVRKGRAGWFFDCGLGKTVMELVWAENVVRHTNKPVLLIAPLAVSMQTTEEAEKFSIQVRRCSNGKLLPSDNIVVTNYERLGHFNSDEFSGVICDESSILKSFNGVRRSEITEFMRTRPYRLLATATAAPNDYIELGTSSEALGELGYTDMLTRFFKNDQHTVKPMRYTGFGSPRGVKQEHTDKWRFKGHAEIPWARWVCSWARAARKPSDLGFDDGPFVLPGFTESQHLVTALTLAPRMLFAMPAVGLKEQREERKRTIRERCQRVAELVHGYDSSWIGCHLNEEGDLLEKIVPDCVQISGKHSDEQKEEMFNAFRKGQIKRLATKYKIGAWGLNFQHCRHVVSFPSHSFEQYYQFVRRCWRFGQKRRVFSDIVTTEGEQVVMENFQRKAANADRMFTNLVDQMKSAQHIERNRNYAGSISLPEWLTGAAS